MISPLIALMELRLCGGRKKYDVKGTMFPGRRLPRGNSARLTTLLPARPALGNIATEELQTLAS